MFRTVLVANRGEIAMRVIRTVKGLGIRAVAVYSDADAGAAHVAAADVAVRIGPAPAADSYLSIDNVLRAAQQTGAEAIHPGYGFLSENAAFAKACAAAGIVFIGPPAAAIDAMGDKIRAKQTVAKAGVPVVPGSEGSGLSDDELAQAAASIGFPVLLKPAAGGGGKGMREVHRAHDLREALAGARREARASFDDETLLLERLVTTPRHIEIQVLADVHGEVIHLGERECSLQRRHQKIIEEAPSPLLTAAQRAAMGDAACEAARSCGYTGAGTVEFIVAGDRPHEFFFMEMNTRLQVEHPVTELVTGLDLVELQLRVAAGERLPLTQQDVRLSGHAIEARVYAEDPAADFLPTGGRILALREPAGVRVDSGVTEGSVVGSDYDPMLAKVIAHGTDRDDALRRLDSALAETVLLGLGTNLGFLRGLLADSDVRAGALDTGLVGRRAGDWGSRGDPVPADVLGAACGSTLLQLEPAGPVVDPFDLPGGWRLGERAWMAFVFAGDGRAPVDVRVGGRAVDADLSIDGAQPVPMSTRLLHHRSGTLEISHCQDGVTRTYYVAREPAGRLWISRDGETWVLRDDSGADAPADASAGAWGPVLSPMPGTITLVRVIEDQAVSAGQPLVVIEAMKMEQILSAPVDGVVRALRARPGDAVAKDAVLLVIDHHDIEKEESR